MRMTSQAGDRCGADQAQVREDAAQIKPLSRRNTEVEGQLAAKMKSFIFEGLYQFFFFK
jgi:hypothetical protein